MFKTPFDDHNFDTDQLFAEPSVSFNVVGCEIPDALKMTPKKLYQQIRELAEKRYKYFVLPKKLTQLRLFEKSVNKMSVLRDICLSLGIVINFSDMKQLIFENDLEKLKEMISISIDH